MNNYNQTDQKIHLLSQVIAKANRTFVPAQADDSHTNLYFDDISHRIYGRWIEQAGNRLVLALDLHNFEFQWLNDSMKPLYRIAISRKDMVQLEHSVEQSLKELGLGTEGFRDDLHFQISSYEFKDLPFTAFKSGDIMTWGNVRATANQACLSLLGYYQVNSEIRIWPHHFDTGIYFEPTSILGIGFGLAMNDSMVGSPYYYFSQYGLNGHEVNYNQLPSLDEGRWIIEEHWKGAVLPLESIPKPETVHTFLADIGQQPSDL